MLLVFCAASGEELLDDSDADRHYQTDLAELTDSDAISEDSGDSYSSDEPNPDEEQELVRIMEQNEDRNVRQAAAASGPAGTSTSKAERYALYYILFVDFC